ncbi:MAG: O-methyltransferase [Erysipelotrichaceae bacterium]|nr:O-methyltransferase [Erysipelotrichaceae bacterium]MDY5251468.1 O-methyltransferase [Erysipelotrichaceae bacterium]
MDIKSYAKEHHVPIMLDDGLAFLLTYIKQHEIKTILEIGTAIGYSSIQMAQLADDIQIDTLEINPEMYELAVGNIRDHNLENRITCHLLDALDFTTDKHYDLVFVDGAKGKYQRYLEHFLNNSELFIFDNLEFHGIVDHPEMTQNRNTRSLVKKIRTFRDDILKDPNYHCEYHKEIGDGVLVLRPIRY